MRTKKKLLVKQLNQKLQPFFKTTTVTVPDRGWIYTIRTTLNMTMAQLGNKLGITRQGVKRIEESEVNGTITLNSLRDIASALDLKFVYAIVPKNGTFDDLIAKKAEKLAKQIILRTNQNMKLENQGIGDHKISEIIQDLTIEIKRDLRKSLWD